MSDAPGRPTGALKRCYRLISFFFRPSCCMFRWRNFTVSILAFIAKPDLATVFDDRAPKVMGDAFDAQSPS
jgi:hypothetical protein